MKLFLILIAALLTACGGGGFDESDSITLELPALPNQTITGFCAPVDIPTLNRQWIGTGRKVLFIGDSLIEGLAPDVRLSEYRTLNNGISGQCTPQIAARFKRDALDPLPDVIVMDGGINDIWQGFNSAAYLSRAAMIAKLAGIKVIIVGVFSPPEGIAPSDYMDRLNKFNAELSDFAKRQNIPYIDNTGPDSTKDLGPDNVHPTQQGRDNLAEKIRLELRKMK